MSVNTVCDFAWAFHYFISVVVMHESVINREACPRGLESAHELLRVRWGFAPFLFCEFFPSAPYFGVDFLLMTLSHVREDPVLVVLGPLIRLDVEIREYSPESINLLRLGVAHGNQHRFSCCELVCGRSGRRLAPESEDLLGVDILVKDLGRHG